MVSDAVQIELIRAVSSIASSFVLTTPGMVAAFFSWKAMKRVSDVHEQGERNYSQMNGRMDQLLVAKQKEGEAIGQQRERDHPSS